ncbi:hypothetical protein [Brevibacterium sp. UCMA 11754]|uniref:hypothetical protein n=1 Tax=Brevibacterium sp. UCMA 11754 TaxID=2749198 RepID=UPI001F31B839|nr:hypothetical protein [Brevibacterium sp. UCMA 11754]
MDSVLDDFVLGHYLEEHSGTASLRILDRGAEILRLQVDAQPLDEFLHAAKGSSPALRRTPGGPGMTYPSVSAQKVA